MSAKLFHKYIRLFAAVLCAGSLALAPALPVEAQAPSAAELLLAANRALPVQSNEVPNWPAGPVVGAESAILMELQTGTILYSKNIHQREYPASTTKILTTLIAAERCQMDEIVTFSSDAIYNTISVERSSSIWRDIGEKMTMEECLYAVMLESANECAYAVAEHVGGSLSKFVKMMNDKAEELGCTSSHFANPHGLPDEKHYLTAHDMAVIARAAYQNETFRLICGTKRYTIPPTNKHSDPTYMTNPQPETLS